MQKFWYGQSNLNYYSTFWSPSPECQPGHRQLEKRGSGQSHRSQNYFTKVKYGCLTGRTSDGFKLDKEILAMTCKSSAVKGLCTRTMKADGNTHWFSWFSPATSHKRFSSYTRHCGSSIIEARTTSFQYSNFHYIVHSKLIMQWFAIKVIVFFFLFIISSFLPLYS